MSNSSIDVVAEILAVARRMVNEYEEWIDTEDLSIDPGDIEAHYVPQLSKLLEKFDER